MADLLPRRTSTRFRGERPLKRRDSPSPPAPPPSRSKAKPPAPRPSEKDHVEDIMPTKLKEAQPLPTLTEPQKSDLSDRQFQSIPESGVMKEALERSRRKWMTVGVFERYWTKPTKKKSMPEVPQPAKESMSRLGNCSMVVEPHTFDITLYTVKEHPLVQYPPPPPPQTYSQYNPYPQTGTYAPAFGPPFTGSSIPDADPPERQPSQTTLPAFREGFGHADTHTPPIPPPSRSPAPPSSRRMSKSSNSSQESRLKENASTDPVIQMLAQRAGQDQRLKDLMKIVATGSAGPEQLKEFQVHIDELNTLLKSPQSPHPPGGNASSAPPPPPPPPTSTAPPSQIPAAPDLTSTSPHPLPSPTTRSPIQKESINPPYPAPYTAPILPPGSHVFPSTPSPAPPQPITTVVFDFATGNGDRYLFPRNTILDYAPGGMSVLASFLIIRQGSATTAPGTKTPKSHYKASKQYYEPVTMRLSASHPRLLEPLARAVSPPEQVRTWMNGVFDRMGRAQKVWLAERLPKEKGAEDGVSEGKAGQAGQAGSTVLGKRKERERGLGKENVREEVKAVYEAPCPMAPFR